jgi:hypothetical protein
MPPGCSTKVKSGTELTDSTSAGPSLWFRDGGRDVGSRGNLRSKTMGRSDPASPRMPNRFAALPPIQVICPECMEEFEADPLALEYRCPRCATVFYSD